MLVLIPSAACCARTGDSVAWLCMRGKAATPAPICPKTTENLYVPASWASTTGGTGRKKTSSAVHVLMLGRFNMNRDEPLYMLDTNVVSYLMDPPETARRIYCQERFDALRGPIAISVLVQAEVFAGLEKRPSQRKELRLRELMRRIRVEYLVDDLWFPDLYGCIRTQMERIGKSTGQFDMAIAAHAMALGATLVSDDKALSHVEHLKLEAWGTPEVAPQRHRRGVAEPTAVYGTRWGIATHDLGRSQALWMSHAPGAGYASAHAR
ncbi:hypothetical protein CDL60_10475 [Roseateles noduli]|nr:hypothetical protein CDL60_10475 [Roseateles noduli]